MPDGSRIRAERREDLGIEGLYEFRTDTPTVTMATVRYWQLHPVGERGGFILEDVTTRVLRRLLEGLAHSKIHRPVEPPPDIGPETRPGVEHDEIPDPKSPGTIRVSRRISTIERLVRQNILTRRHRWAADELYSAYMVGVAGARIAEDELPPGVHIDPWRRVNVSHARSAAHEDYARAMGLLGGKLARALLDLVVDDRSLMEIAARLRWDRRRAMGYLQAGLEVIAVYFDAKASERRKKNAVDNTARGDA
jgi:DNA-directed RNA polymerase specialized sigma24 family protein